MFSDWPLLLARVRHLAAELRSSYAAFGGVPMLARTRTGRQLLALGSSGAARLRAEWPEVERLTIWPDLHRVLIASDGTRPRLRPLGPAFDEPLLDPSRDKDPRALARQHVRRLAYLRTEEFDDVPIGLVSMSNAWLMLRGVPAALPHLLEAYLDSDSPVEREVIRFVERDARTGRPAATDDEFFRQVADTMDRYPATLSEASPAQLDRFRRAGMVSATFGLEQAPAATRSAAAAEISAAAADTVMAAAARGDVLVDRFVIERSVPGSDGSSLHLGVDRETGVPILATKLLVSDDDPPVAEDQLWFPEDGIAPLLLVARTDVREGRAQVLVEALPRRATRSDEGMPLPLPSALALADRVAAILETVHASGRCVVGLRPELTFYDFSGHVTLAPRSDLLRGVLWREGPRSEGQQSPFREIYLAYELLVGATAVPASDVFSLCAMLTYWIQASHPFARDSLVDRLHAMANESPNCDGLPTWLADTVSRGLSADPSRRPTVAELRRSFG